MLVFRQSFEKGCDVDVGNNMMIREDVEGIGIELRVEHEQKKNKTTYWRYGET